MLLIIRHDIMPQKFRPNNPSISPQLANLNVLANSKGHDLQIVGNIWIFPQELGSSFFIKYKCFHLGAHCVTFSTNRSSYQKLGLHYIQTDGVVRIYFMVRDHTPSGYLQYLHCSWCPQSCHGTGAKAQATEYDCRSCPNIKLDLTLHPQERTCEWFSANAYLGHPNITKSILQI